MTSSLVLNPRFSTRLALARYRLIALQIFPFEALRRSTLSRSFQSDMTRSFPALLLSRDFPAIGKTKEIENLVDPFQND